MKVSIITATYNCERSVADAIDSVLAQSYDDIEYVVVDGASSDGTVDVIKEKTAGIKDLKFVSEPDKGIYDALNKGISMATGDVIGFLHADDIYASDSVISDVVNVFSSAHSSQLTDNVGRDSSDGEQPEIDSQLSTNSYQLASVYGDLEYVKKEDVSKVIRYWKSGEYNPAKLKRGWMPPHPSFFVRREVYEKYGVFDTTLKIAADYDFMMRVLFKEKISTVYLPEVLIKMRLGGASNRSLKNIISKSREDLTAMSNNGISAMALAFKNLSKLQQFVRRGNS